MLKTGTNNSEIDNFAPISLPQLTVHIATVCTKSDWRRNGKVRLFLSQCGWNYIIRRDLR